MLLYALQVFAATAALLLCHHAALARRPYHRASRLMLYAAVVLPLLLPLIPRSAGRSQLLQPVQIQMPEVTVLPDAVLFATPADNHLRPAQIAGIAYALVALALLAAYGTGYHRWARRLRAFPATALPDGTALKTNTGYGPGSFAGVAFVPGPACDPAIIRHEAAHVRLRHFEELCGWRIACCLLWPHLLLWLALRRLRALHEYEADGAAATPHNRESYAALLLQSTLGTRNPIPQTFSFQPLKNRIVMLYKEQTSKGRRQAWAMLTTILALATGAVMMVECKPAGGSGETSMTNQDSSRTDSTIASIAERGVVAVSVSPNDSEAYQQAKGILGYHNKYLEVAIPGYVGKLEGEYQYTDVPEGDSIYKTAAHMPEFVGSISQWLSANVRYPDSARKANQEGRVVTKFVIDATGAIRDVEVVKSSGTQELDDEAVRVIKAMPNWKPGRTKSGQAVPVYFYLPVAFQLK